MENNMDTTTTLYAALLALTTTSLILLPLLLWRLKIILSPTRPKPRPISAHILIVLGSGGHTAEMLSMLQRAGLDWQKFRKRTWVVSSGDGISAERAMGFEQEVIGGSGVYGVEIVPRAREIHQSLLTAPMSCLRCAWACLAILTRYSDTDTGDMDLPDLILCNGPATATILVFTSVLLRFFDVGGCQSRGKMRSVYVESWARVKRVSLSGRLLGFVVDRFLVQWDMLEGCAGGRGEFVGVVV